ILFRVVGNRFLEIWGPVETLTPEKQVALAKTRALLTNDALDKADRGRGHEVFKQRCAACHQMHGEGGKIGPDLTGANRTDLEYLLSNILTPSAIVQDDYKMRMVHTKDGRFFSGVVVSEDDRQLRLRIANEEPVAIARSQIADLEVSELSMMPEGLLNGLTDQQVVELFAYLRSLEPVTAPGTADR
ncbi:c-type cytochrome, partial [bacterium]|nr:c-type cytochrome [bacterium]